LGLRRRLAGFRGVESPEANVAHIRQSRPYSGLGFEANVLKQFSVVPSPLASGGRGGSRAKREHLTKF